MPPSCLSQLISCLSRAKDSETHFEISYLWWGILAEPVGVLIFSGRHVRSCPLPHLRRCHVVYCVVIQLTCPRSYFFTYPTLVANCTFVSSVLSLPARYVACTSYRGHNIYVHVNLKERNETERRYEEGYDANIWLLASLKVSQRYG